MNTYILSIGLADRHGEPLPPEKARIVREIYDVVSLVAEATVHTWAPNAQGYDEQGAPEPCATVVYSATPEQQKEVLRWARLFVRLTDQRCCYSAVVGEASFPEAK